MKTLQLDLTSANIAALDADLRAALPAHFYGLTFDGKQVTLILDDATKPADIRQAQTIVAEHDPAKLTAEQQTAILQAAKLDQARKEFAADELDLSGYQGKDALLEKLAQKIVWLEREIRALRPST